ncbi:MAG: hypothetical protein RIG62_28370 [Cyclobacteriaceae bacterium]
MAIYPDIPGKYEKVYTITIDNLLNFEVIKSKLLSLKGIEDILFNDQPSPCEMTLLTDGTVTAESVQRVVGYEAFPKKIFIS